MFGLDMIDAFIGLIFVYLTLSLIVTAFGEAIAQAQNLRGDTLKKAVSNLLGEALSKEVYDSHHIQALTTRANKKPPSYIPDRVFSTALVDCLLDGKAQESRANPAKFGTLLESALNKPATDPKLKAALSAFRESSNFNVDTFIVSVNQWFNDAADRLPGNFKRKMSKRLFLIGFLVAAALNANSINMYNQLTDNPELRNEYLTKATELAKEDKAPSLEGICEPGTTCTPSMVAKRQALAVLPLIGWNRNAPPLTRLGGAKIQHKLEYLLMGAYALVGWLLTAAALSLGAPFWFDLLQKLVKVRGSLKPLPSTAAGQPPPGGVTGDVITTGVQVTPTELENFTSFKHASLGFSKINALWLARASDLAYQEKEVVEARLREWGVTGSLHSGGQGTQFITLESPRVMVVAFRGTETGAFEDFITDAKAKLIEPGWTAVTGLEVHTGFHDALESSWSVVEQVLEGAVTADKPIWLCGHSLGGALAVLTAHRLATHGVSVSGGLKKPMLGALYTYGQPRCGNEAFVDELESTIGNRYYRSVNNRDVVPLVPPPISALPYRHTGQVAYFNEFGDFILDPPLWYRALDKLELSTDQVSAKLKETVSDHSMNGYVQLYRKLLP